MAVQRGERFDVDALLLRDDGLVVVDSSTVVAAELVLLDGYHHVVGKTKMDEGVHTSTVFLEHLCLLDISGEVSENESISASVGKSQKLKGNSVFDLLINISVIIHFFNLEEKWVIEFFRLAGKLRNVIHNLGHRDNWKTHINTESLNNLVLVGVWCGKENNFRTLWPSPQEFFTLGFDECFQHFFLLFNN